MERDEEMGREKGVYMSILKIYKVTHYTNTRMVLNSLEVTLRILCVIDNKMQQYLYASSTNSACQGSAFLLGGLMVV